MKEIETIRPDNSSEEFCSKGRRNGVVAGWHRALLRIINMVNNRHHLKITFLA